MMDKDNHFDAQDQSSPTPYSQPVNFEDEERSQALPEGKHTSQKNSLRGSLYLSEVVDQQTLLLIRLLGYGLLVLASIDYVYIVIPAHLTNPLWEFETIGALVEHAALPLLGLIFVFYRHKGYIVKREKKLLWFLSWVSLLLGLLYLLMLPLGVADTWRIYHASNAQITAQLSQQSQEFQQIKGKLNEATTEEQLEQLVASLTPEGGSLQIKDPQAFKDKFLAQITESERKAQVQADTASITQSQELLKNSLKWNLGSLIAGVLFMWVWHLTSWTRVRKKY